MKIKSERDLEIGSEMGSIVCISDLFGGYSVICVMSNCSIADITSKK